MACRLPPPALALGWIRKTFAAARLSRVGDASGILWIASALYPAVAVARQDVAAAGVSGDEIALSQIMSVSAASSSEKFGGAQKGTIPSPQPELRRLPVVALAQISVLKLELEQLLALARES